MKDSIKQAIIRYIEAEGGWQYAGKIEDHIRSLMGSKASNASRRMRELEVAGILEKQLVQINNEGPRVVQYKLVDVKEDPYAEELDEIQEDTTSMEEKIEQIERLNL